MKIYTKSGLEYEVELSFASCTQRYMGYTLTRLSGDALLDFGKRVFLLRPSAAFIRTCPTGDSYMFYKYNHYDQEYILKIELTENERKLML
ncbi:hypothetical protein SDC9_57801 [bioreactor metagenome]|uniref:Uncharacterized protein n=1 Tax=bioreactor metagenome TaxID=1076179 RepID=A0A644X678_9ZZZZ